MVESTGIGFCVTICIMKKHVYVVQLKKAMTRWNMQIIIGIVISAAFGASALAYIRNSSPQVGKVAIETGTDSITQPTKTLKEPVPKPDPEQVKPTPAPDTAKPSPTPVPAKIQTAQATAVPAVSAPAPIPVDFTLNPATVTLTQGVTSPVLQAISTTGEPLEWAVLGGHGIMASSGITSNGRFVTHSFILTPSPQITAPGTYPMNIMGYIPGGPSVTKQLIIIVIAP